MRFHASLALSLLALATASAAAPPVKPSPTPPASALALPTTLLKELKPRAVDAEGRTVRFEDDSKLEPDAVIWATGYRPDYSWIDLPVFGEDGRLRHRRGVTAVPGIYFLGLTWQHTRGSALIGWVKDDAEFLADRIGDRLKRAAAGEHVEAA